MQEDDRGPIALLAHEAPEAAGRKAAACCLVRLDCLACPVAGAGHRRMIASVARWGIRPAGLLGSRVVPLTRSGEARKGREHQR